MADSSETTETNIVERGSVAAVERERSEVLDAIRELSERVATLQSELQALRGQTVALPPGEASGWDDAKGDGPDMLTWVRALDAPGARAPAVPRLLLEIVFLVAVAVGVAIAELDLVEILAVRAGAWLLVAIAELVAARAARRRAELVYGPLPGLASGYPSDPSWLAPPVERTMLEVDTAAGETRAKLPPPDDDEPA